MSAGSHAANIVDFASYRAHRRRATAADSADSAAGSTTTFNVIPMMIPIVAWIPVWQLPSFAWPGEAIDE